MVLSVPDVSVAMTETVKFPDAVGVPLMAMLPLPFWVADNPVGNPVTPALDSGSADPINKLAA